MFSELSHEIISSMDDKYLHLFASMSGAEFSKYLSEQESVPVMDMLYITMQFCKGLIDQLPHHASPIVDDHEDSINILVELQREGVLTFDGQRSTSNDVRQRSYLFFIISFDQEQYEYIIQLLEELHSKGLNVWARIEEKHSDENRYVSLFKAPKDYPSREYDIYALNDTNEINISKDAMVHFNDPSIKAKTDLYEVTENSTCVFPYCRFEHMHMQLEYSHYYRLTCNVFNIEWDMLQADEIVLESVRELKARLM